jgi:H+/gluconate symporter-like permease
MNCLEHTTLQLVFLVGVVLGMPTGVILTVLFGHKWLRKDGE